MRKSKSLDNRRGRHRCVGAEVEAFQGLKCETPGISHENAFLTLLRGYLEGEVSEFERTCSGTWLAELEESPSIQLPFMAE